MAKRSWIRVGLPLLLVAGLFVPVATRSAEGRIPLFEQGPITASGKYVLTRDIVGNGLDGVIAVHAERVEIDLNGFTISNGNGEDCIQVLNSSVRLVVRNGNLRNCHSAVWAPVGTHVVVEDVTVRTSGNSINVLDVGTVAIRRVTVEGTAFGDAIAIYSSDMNFDHNAVIEDCTVKSAVGTGISFTGGTVRIRNNRVTSAGSGGIWVIAADGSEVSGNLVVGVNGQGISLVGTHGSTIEGNVVRLASSHGIVLAVDATKNLVRDNVATSNGPGFEHGLFVQGTSNKVEGNTLNDNGGAGLYFDSSGCRNTFGRNMAEGNAGTGVTSCTTLFPPDSCDQCSAGAANKSFGDNLIPGPPVF
jgi:parallel beta-helix repeat protein